VIRKRLHTMIDQHIVGHAREVTDPQIAALTAVLSERIAALEVRADALEARARALESAATDVQHGLKRWTSVVDGIVEQNLALRAMQREIDDLAGRPLLGGDGANDHSS